MADELLTVAEVAEQLKVNPRTGRNWIDRDQLSAVRVGQRRVRIRPADLAQFIGARDAAASAERPPPREAAAEATLSVDREVTDAGEGDRQGVDQARRRSRSRPLTIDDG